MEQNIYEQPPPRFLVWLGRLILRVFGWRADATVPTVPKYLIIFVPHTSNWDALFALSAAMVMGMRPVFTVKHTAFKGPWGGLFRYLGAYPIDRTATHGYVDQMIDLFNRSKRLAFAVTPEATRGRSEHWKSGFYHIAHGAQVPIALAGMDYKRKRVILSPDLIYTTGDIQSDMQRIAAFYDAGIASGEIVAKYPENVGPVRLRSDATPVEQRS
jgi:1-acyl-sn-glycerol-3-phosphate acyltransferase